MQINSNFLHIILNDPRKILHYRLFSRVSPFTQQGYGALSQVYDFMKWIDNDGVGGGAVEIGCWKGGVGALMGRMTDRDIWLFDSFEGFPEHSEKDDSMQVQKKNDSKRMFASEMDVRNAFKTLGVKKPPHVVRGWVEKTIPQQKDIMGKIALLRIDVDLYEPTKAALELYDNISPGGIIIMDDYEKWVGARRALYEFFTERNITPALTYYPAYGGRAYFRKT